MLASSSPSKQYLYLDRITPTIKSRLHSIVGASYDRSKRRWFIPFDSYSDLKRYVPTMQLDAQTESAIIRYEKKKQHILSIKELKDIDLPEIKGLKAELYPYQKVGVAFLDQLEDNQGAILGFDMGLGKSLTSLATFMLWKQKGIVDYCLVVCPAPLKYATWAKEIEKWTDLSYIVIDGKKREEVQWDDGTVEKLSGKKLRQVQYQQYLFGTDVLIMNYELFLHDRDILPKFDRRWCVILDEAHRIKNAKGLNNPKAKPTITKVVHETLKNQVGRKILGTGTPLQNDLSELWSLVDFCRPHLLGSPSRFNQQYMILDEYFRPIAPKYQMLDDFKQRIAPIILRKTKEDALPNLPELVVQDYWVELTPKQKKLYKEVAEGILYNLKSEEFKYLDVLPQLIHLQQVCDSPALLRELTGDDSLPVQSGKLKVLKEIIEDLNPAVNKFILFSQFRSMTDILYNWLVEQKLLKKSQIGYVHGDTDSFKIGEIQDGFQNGDIQCVVMTTAGNYGLNLSAGSYVICYDQLFNPQVMQQIYSRCHRNGAKNAVTAINLLTKNTYEERKLQILKEKKALFEDVIDYEGDSAYLQQLTVEELLALI